jgi:tetratricopeptide (TPR) repeat protein
MSGARATKGLMGGVAAAFVVAMACRADRLVCQDELAARHFERAAAVCGRAAPGDATAGRLAGRALLSLQRPDEMSRVAHTLGTQGDRAGEALLRGQVGNLKRDFVEAERWLTIAAREATGDRELSARTQLETFTLLRETNRLGEALRALAAADRLARQGGGGASADLTRQIAFAAFDFLYDIGDLDRAERALRAAAALALPEHQPYVHYKEALVFWSRGQTSIAAMDFAKAAALARKGDERLLWSAGISQAELRREAGQGALAEATLEAAWRAAPAAIQVPEAEARYRLEKLRLARTRGDLGTAHQQLERARALGSKSEDVKWAVAYQEGLLMLASGELDQAQGAFEEAVGIIDRMRGRMVVPNLRDRMATARREPFSALFQLHLQRGDARAALAVAERVQARSFMDAFAEALPSANGTSAAGSDLEGGALRFEGLLRLMPPLTSSRLVDARPIEETLAAIGDASVLFYFQAQRQLYLVAIEAGRVRVWPLSVNAADLLVQVSRYRASPNDVMAAKELGQALLPPGALPASRRIFVVPTPALARLPLAAVFAGDQRLVERHDIALVPSLAALGVLLRGPRRDTAGTVVLADPTADLPGARQEAGALAGRLTGAHFFTGGQAMAARLRETPPGGLLHIAAHSGIGEAGAWLALADGKISSVDLIDWRLRPRLVFLASCASGVSTEEGLWGSLGGAFLAGGAETVVSTLWSIGDGTTRDFALAFYAQDGERDPIGALGRAQRAQLASGAPVSAWAPFMVMGAVSEPPAGGHQGRLHAP